MMLLVLFLLISTSQALQGISTSNDLLHFRAKEVNVHGAQITNLGAPLMETAAVSKQYVDGAVIGGGCTGLCPAVDASKSSYSCNATHVVAGKCFSCEILPRNEALQPLGDVDTAKFFRVLLDDGVTPAYLPPETVEYYDGPGFPSFIATICPTELGWKDVFVDFYGTTLVNGGTTTSISVTGSEDLNVATFSLLCTTHDTPSPRVECAMGAEDTQGYPASPSTPFSIEFLYEGSAVPDFIAPVPLADLNGGAWTFEHSYLLTVDWIWIGVSYGGNLLDSFNSSIVGHDCPSWTTKVNITNLEYMKLCGILVQVTGPEAMWLDLGPVLYNKGITFSGASVNNGAYANLFDLKGFNLAGTCGDSWPTHCLETNSDFQMDFFAPVKLAGFSMNGYCSDGDPNFYGPSNDWTIQGAPGPSGPWTVLKSMTATDFQNMRFEDPHVGYPPMNTICFDDVYEVRSIKFVVPSITPSGRWIMCNLGLWGM